MKNFSAWLRGGLLLAGLCAFGGMATEAVAAKKGHTDRAACLDGRDNNLRIGMGILEAPYTLELWMKGNDTQWNEKEMLIAGGDYSYLNWVDNEPLMVLNGYLHSAGARLTAPEPLDDRWHHVALTCDGTTTTLYQDGKAVAKRDTAIAVLPGALGIQGGRSNNDGKDFFGGMLDEVRIWRKAVDAETLKAWMGRSVTTDHPCFDGLYGYYPLDDMDHETAVNWTGRGHLNHHLRNGRNKQGGDAPLAHAVVSDNTGFQTYKGKQRLFNAVVIQSEWDSDQGAADQQALKLRIAVQGEARPLKLRELELDLSGTTNLEDIEAVHVSYTGDKARHRIKQELFGKGRKPERHMVFSAPAGRAVTLQPGINYILVTFDVARRATVGNTLRATVPTFRLDETACTPDTTADETLKKVVQNSKLNPDVVKVLQWNIWHGGRHVGAEGPQRVMELIEAQHPDVVLMQEAYGIQDELAKRLGYKLKSKSSGDNLALYTHLPMEEVPWRDAFKSNPAILTLANGKQAYFQCLWLMYSYNPEYTAYFPQKGQDPRLWAGQDCGHPLTDITNIVEKDVDKYSRGLPVIVTGDFNSCSHLDWTKRAAPLHYGYGQVDFPVSKYMRSQGFHDTFRQQNPDEVAYHGGTISEVHEQMQNARIDFIYHRGENVRVQASKIVRTTPDIDFVWPSDHAAVMAVFEIK